jgi:type I restriction enzyme S subunit
MRTGPFGSTLRHSEFVDRGIAVLGIDNAVQNRFAWAERRFITEKKYEKFERYTVRPGDVIVTIMGTTGRSAVVPEDIPLAISTKHLAVITVDRSRVHPQFLSHAFHSDQTVLAQISAANRGAIMSGLNLGIIKRVRIRLPPLAAQQRFAYLVRTVSETRDRLSQASVEVDGLFDSLAQRAFRGVL